MGDLYADVSGVFIPSLPPRKGYVEIEQDGVRVYAPTVEESERIHAQNTLTTSAEALTALLGALTKLEAQACRRVLQLFVQDITDESTMLEVASVYPEWTPERAYAAGAVLRYGKNADGEPQLYRVEQGHVSQADWAPDKATALFRAVGFAESGVPIWTQPLGAHDAYKQGDEVMHKDRLWRSGSDGNVWEPGVYGWEEVTE